MSDLEQYIDKVFEPRPVAASLPRPAEPATYAVGAGGPPGQQVQQSDVFRGILRKWYVALVVFIVLAGAGIPAIWILVEPKYTVT
ncbi:MAG: hypothetical protein QHH07_12805, partial [Sedimentisphaerales bacterium]|nr:hypothetical protein [Sedimentisphaerales bacterium]